MRLTPRNIAILFALGTALWFAAALFVRFGAPYGVVSGDHIWITNLLLVPVTWPFVVMARKLVGGGPRDHMQIVGVVTLPALLLDGTAMAQFPALYGSDIATVQRDAAAILWGAGVGLVIALVMDQRAAAATSVNPRA